MAQSTRNADYFGELYQDWTQIGDVMSILTPDNNLSTDLIFETTDNPPYSKVSVVVLSESMQNVYLNGDSIEVCDQKNNYPCHKSLLWIVLFDYSQ